MNIKDEFEKIYDVVLELKSSIDKQQLIDKTSSPNRDNNFSHKEFFSITEAAKYLGISHTAFKEVANRQELPTYRFANVRKNLYKRKDIDRLIKVKYDTVN